MTLGAIANPFPNPQNDAVQCGTNTCNNGDVCCNESCGICTPPGGLCTQQACKPPTDSVDRPVKCGPNTCKKGDVCCNESCGICTPPRGTSNAVLQSAGEARSAVIRAVEFALPLVEGVPNKPASLPPRNAARRPALLAKCAATPAVESALLLVGLVPNKSVRILRRQSMICDMN
ncbi:uncharacterized protein PADG_01011 [Paracoccidioides brasiliensis Pb18]|uniref:Uncharacterized protein n=2 Tax=Paracoccidioides brasiliensis TaxID=121759 RepID=C1FYY5_PARBD|nr:uncharacterized protein PADG_01011 [Paracoccidioides brasiliensis Pb18]EEH44722.2 hypothetical protein PADG_01011 [Paracoccidioides brasiliensis Pb18]ODH13554.1 hypothetical protein ACO22_07145 [Paracoccidioides brasiliensis]